MAIICKKISVAQNPSPRKSEGQKESQQYDLSKTPAFT